jgi:hypothetical protein
MTKPFFYIISWTKEDTHYAGIRYRSGCHPDDLWTKYFTSGKKVKAFREQHGEPDKFEIIEFSDLQALFQKEIDFLKDKIKDERWLNVRYDHWGLFRRNEESTEAMRAKLRGRVRSEEFKEKHRKPRSAESVAKQQATRIANGLNKRSDEDKAKISAGNKGKKRTPEQNERNRQLRLEYYAKKREEKR